MNYEIVTGTPRDTFFVARGLHSFLFLSDAFDLSLLDPQLVQLLALQRLQQLRAQLQPAAAADLQAKVKVEQPSDVTKQNGDASAVITAAASTVSSEDVKPSKSTIFHLILSRFSSYATAANKECFGLCVTLRFSRSVISMCNYLSAFLY